MTVKECVQGVMLIFCMMFTSVVLPIILIVGSTAHDAVSPVASAGPVFIFEKVR